MEGGANLERLAAARLKSIDEWCQREHAPYPPGHLVTLARIVHYLAARAMSDIHPAGAGTVLTTPQWRFRNYLHAVFSLNDAIDRAAKTGRPASIKRHATAADLAAAFHVHGDTEARNLSWWKNITGNASSGSRYKWLHDCMESQGSRGKEPSLWNPASVAIALVGQGKLAERAAKAAVRKHFPEWADLYGND